ncbi:MAG: sugar ABC transporter ATP-binding protein [Propionibacteriaceae bacterium]|jgi:ribose transport system ATP-binding protein|nr:sugar ABC transporter ATP-binding protein [Propionibacteriaceae bacterium]
MNDTSEVVLRATAVTKRYAGVTALDSVSFDLRAGEVHCLVGENGAGKSTLIKAITGAITPDSGTIVLDGNDITKASMRTRRDLGLAVIYQDLQLVPQLSVAENIFLGAELKSGAKLLDKRTMNARAKELLDNLGVSFRVDARVGELGISLQQLTATARAISRDSRVLIMDEPSAVLSGHELDVLFGVVKRLTERGIGIIYISHRLEEIFRIGDRVTVLRDGHYIATSNVADTDQPALIRQMVGRDVEAYQNDTIDAPKGAEVLRLENVGRKGALHDISFTVREGEVVGIAGLVGAGRTELARVIMGLDRLDTGQVYLGGKPVKISDATKAVSQGIALVPEDRRAEGLVSMLSVEQNACLSVIATMSPFWLVNYRAMHQKVGEAIQAMAVKAASVKSPVSGLSGGNQQKVVLAKCLSSECKLLIMDEPTVGIDVGAKKEIYNLIGKLKEQGLAVIVISSELPEILTVSDRILVMSAGRVRGEVDPRSATQEEILELAIPPMSAILEEVA